jgi:HTH-type transcriptional regulator, glycine betaine synthesis regulator
VIRPQKNTPAALASALRDAQDRFIAVWGQMAGAWGISRTMAEVHALLYITGGALCTDDIMERLDISRGNASMSLRALLDWGIVERAHKRGDRKEYFQSEQDVWAMFRAIVRERIKREVDPLLASLYEIRDMSVTPATPSPTVAPDPAELAAAVATHTQRVDAMLDFFRTLESLGQRFVSPAGRGLQIAATLLAGAPNTARDSRDRAEVGP